MRWLPAHKLHKGKWYSRSVAAVSHPLSGSLSSDPELKYGYLTHVRHKFRITST